MINELGKQIHQRNIEKGFFDEKRNIGEIIALIHSELSEALEADRKDEYCNLNETSKNVLMRWGSEEDFITAYDIKVKGSFEEEMADVAIRLFDLCAYLDIDLEFHIKAKMRYNAARPYKHNKKY